MTMTLSQLLKLTRPLAQRPRILPPAECAHSPVALPPATDPAVAAFLSLLADILRENTKRDTMARDHRP